MDYTMSATVIGSEALARAFAQAPEIVGRNMRDALNKTAYKAEAVAKEAAPHQYGHLRGSIHTEGATDRVLEAKVGTQLKYAPYQEFGTGIYGPNAAPITPKKGKVLAWKSGGRWHFAKSVRGTKGKFYFKKAKDQSQPDLDRNLKIALGSIVTSLAQGA